MEFETQYKETLYNLHNLLDYHIKQGKKYQINPYDMDLFEHCIIEASGNLSLLHELNNVIRLGHSGATKNQINQLPIAILLGIANTAIIAHEANLLTIARSFLNIFPSNFHLNLINNDDILYDFQNDYYQYCILLNPKKAIKTFITNPFFTAQYIIDHPNEIKDSISLNAVCSYLINKMDQFIGLRKSIPSKEIGKLKAGLTRITVECILAETALSKKFDGLDLEQLNILIELLASHKSIPNDQSAIYLSLLNTYAFFCKADSEKDEMTELQCLVNLYQQYPQETTLFLVNIGEYYIEQNQFATAWLVLYSLLSNKKMEERTTQKIKISLANLLMTTEKLSSIFPKMANAELRKIKYQLVVYLLKDEASTSHPDSFANLLTRQAIRYLMSKEDNKGKENNKIDSLLPDSVSYNDIPCVFYSLTVLKKAGQELIHLYKEQSKKLDEATLSDSAIFIEELENLLSTEDDSIDYLIKIVLLLRDLLNFENICKISTEHSKLKEFRHFFQQCMIVPYEIFNYDFNQDDKWIKIFIDAVTPKIISHQTYISFQRLKSSNELIIEVTNNEQHSLIKHLAAITEYSANTTPVIPAVATEDKNLEIPLSELEATSKTKINSSSNSCFLFSNDTACNQFARVVASYFDRKDITVSLNKKGMMIQHEMSGPKDNAKDKEFHDFIRQYCHNASIKHDKNNRCNITIKNHDDIINLVNACNFSVDYFYKANKLLIPTARQEKCLIM